MKEVTMYQCEICNELHDSSVKANECEEKGIGVPIGKIGDEIDHLEGYMDDFDIPVYRPCKIVGIRIDNHDVKYELCEIDNEGNLWQELCTFEIGQDEYLFSVNGEEE